MIAYQHPLQRSKVLSLLSKLLVRSTTLNPVTELQIKKTFIEAIIFLIHCGYVLPSLHLMNKISGTLDQSLIRHFVLQVSTTPKLSFALF